MKVIVCEMCGSNQVVKQDGLFVCQSCETKYSVAEARKLMGEGTVEVQGTVKVDVSDELNNLYQFARRAKDDDNSENAAKYYDMILIKDPSSWEAFFYSLYFQAAKCEVSQIQSACVSIANSLDTVLGLITDHADGDEEKESAIREVALRSTSISSVLFDKATAHYEFSISTTSSDFDKDKFEQEMLSNCCAARDLLYLLGDTIDTQSEGNHSLHNISVSAWEKGVNRHNWLMRYFDDKDSNRTAILKYVKKIQKYDDSYQPPTIDVKHYGAISPQQSTAPTTARPFGPCGATATSSSLKAYWAVLLFAYTTPQAPLL